jgi:autotransporter-associated beta strand protein
MTISPGSGIHIHTLFAGSPSALGTGNVTIGPYGKLDLNGQSNTTGLLISTNTHGLVTNDGEAYATLTLSSTSTQTYGGIIQDGARMVSIVKDGSGTQLLTGANSFGGDTTVAAGTLSLGQVNSSNEASTVSIASDAILNLGFVGIDTVDKLFINGIEQARGDYTSAHASGRFTGGGTLRVTSGPLPPGFDSWVDGFDLPFEDQDPTDDPDNDGMDNLLEFVLNGNPGLADSSILPQLVVTETHFEFIYQRRIDSITPETTQTFRWGITLATWPGSADIPAASGPVGAATVTVSAGVPSAAVTDTVKIRIPKSEAGASGRLLGRLQVVKP